MDKFGEYFAAAQEYLKQNPDLFGIVIALPGLMMLIGALRDWNWIFGDVSKNVYTLKKLDGIINWFGRKTGRIYAGISGVVLIAFGICWFVVFRYYY